MSPICVVLWERFASLRHSSGIGLFTREKTQSPGCCNTGLLHEDGCKSKGVSDAGKTAAVRMCLRGRIHEVARRRPGRAAGTGGAESSRKGNVGARAGESGIVSGWSRVCG